MLIFRTYQDTKQSSLTRQNAKKTVIGSLKECLTENVLNWSHPVL